MQNSIIYIHTTIDCHLFISFIYDCEQRQNVEAFEYIHTLFRHLIVHDDDVEFQKNRLKSVREPRSKRESKKTGELICVFRQ